MDTISYFQFGFLKRTEEQLRNSVRCEGLPKQDKTTWDVRQCCSGKTFSSYRNINVRKRVNKTSGRLKQKTIFPHTINIPKLSINTCTLINVCCLRTQMLRVDQNDVAMSFAQLVVGFVQLLCAWVCTCEVFVNCECSYLCVMRKREREGKSVTNISM